LGPGIQERRAKARGRRPKSLREAFRALFSLDAPPRTKAVAFAVGVFVAFTPTYGLHTVTVILFSWLFRLPFSIVLLGSLVNNPWTFFPIYGASYVVGRWLLSFFPSCYTPMPFGVLAHQLKSFSWNDWLAKAPGLLLREGLPFVVGSLVLGVVAAVFSYFLVLWLLSIKGRGETQDGRGKDGDENSQGAG